VERLPRVDSGGSPMNPPDRPAGEMASPGAVHGPRHLPTCRPWTGLSEAEASSKRHVAGPV
jgi:hypothetical protein